MPWPQLIKANSPDIKSSHMLQSIFKHLLFLWASQLISQRLFSWRWRGWDTSSEPPGPSRPPPSAAWWKRWPTTCPAPLLADERSPQAVGTSWKNVRWGKNTDLQLDLREKGVAATILHNLDTRSHTPLNPSNTCNLKTLPWWGTAKMTNPF